LTPKDTTREKRASAIYSRNPPKLNTLVSTRAEMARVYRLTLQGKIEPEKMTKLIFALKEIRACIEIDLLDEAPRRLEELRAKVEQRD
jgi:hypothetical protein